MFYQEVTHTYFVPASFGGDHCVLHDISLVRGYLVTFSIPAPQAVDNALLQKLEELQLTFRAASSALS